jgi:putative peptidoglycan lipid II flippase
MLPARPASGGTVFACGRGSFPRPFPEGRRLQQENHSLVKRQTILAGAGIMAAAAFLSRILGWVRDRQIGHYWGIGPHTDSYWAAFMVPDLLYYILAGGALGASVIPVFTAYLREGKEEESWKAANTLATLLGLLALVGIGLIILFAPGMVTLAAAGFRKDLGKVSEAAMYVRILAPMVFFTVLSALFTGILQAHRHFTAPAFAWLVYNVGIIAGAMVGGHYFAAQGDVAGLRVVAMGVVVGAALLVAVQIPALVARGFRYRPTLDLSHPGVREVMRRFLPYMAGLAFTQICLLWLPSFFGSDFPNGGITSLRYANRLVVLPLGLFGVAISTAAFPAMAERIAAGEVAEFRKLFSGSLRAVFFLSVPCTAILVVLAGPILRLLWRTGRFDETAINAATFCLVYYAVALIGLSGLQIVNRAFYSLKDTRTPPLVGASYTIIIVAMALGLKGSWLQYAAIALATSVGVTVGMVVMFELLRRRLGRIDGTAITLSFLRVTLASGVLAVVAYYVAQISGQMLHVPTTHFSTTAPSFAVITHAKAAVSVLHVAVQVMLSLGAGGIAYVLALRLLRAPELQTFQEALASRRSGAGADTPGVA